MPRTRAEKLEATKAWNAANKEHVRAYRKRRADACNLLFDMARAGPCADCGARLPAVCMDFDHRDPSTKVKSPSELKWSPAKLMAEIAKCDLVCSNCHRLRTHLNPDGSRKLNRRNTNES